MATTAQFYSFSARPYFHLSLYRIGDLIQITAVLPNLPENFGPQLCLSLQDHMRAQDWDPKTFFAMHDLNGDRFWDEDEVRVSWPSAVAKWQNKLQKPEFKDSNLAGTEGRKQETSQFYDGQCSFSDVNTASLS